MTRHNDHEQIRHNMLSLSPLNDINNVRWSRQTTRLQENFNKIQLIYGRPLDIIVQILRDEGRRRAEQTNEAERGKNVDAI